MHLLELATIFFHFAFAVPQDNSARLLETMNYFLSRSAFVEGFEISERIKIQPHLNLNAFKQIADLNLLYKGRLATADLFRQYLELISHKLSPEDRDNLKAHWEYLQMLFLTDRGQSAYYQALQKMRNQQWVEALGWLSQAAAHEGHHLGVLREKAKCEKKTASLDKLYESLKDAYRAYPYDPYIVENLIEAHLRSRKPELVVEMSKIPTFSSSSKRTDLGIGYALVELKQGEKALSLLSAVVHAGKHGIHPIVFFSLGKIYSEQNKPLIASSFFEQFLAVLPKENSSTQGATENSDPYPTLEKAEEAKKWLSENNRRAPRS